MDGPEERVGVQVVLFKDKVVTKTKNQLSERGLCQDAL